MSRLRQFAKAAKRLEQSLPHLNTRPIRVRGLIAGETCLDFLNRKIPSQSPDYWKQALLQSELANHGLIICQDFVLRSSDKLTHTLLENAEPAIPTQIQIIYEDDVMLVIHKPAGLPVHPCGRYHFHSFTKIAEEAWPELNLHLVHRLDTETSGVLVLAKNKQAARNLTEQFEQRNVKKIYLAQVSPIPSWTELTCNMAISNQKGEQGRRFCDAQGQPAITKLRHLSPGLIEARPISGRTNQIRAHLEYLGHPIVGDSIYGSKTGGQLQLQAWKISLRHPLTGKPIQLQTACE